MKGFLIALVVIVLIGGGIFAAVKLSANKKQTSESSTSTTQSSQSQSSTSTEVKSGEVNVSISNFAFPAIKVSKGTKVSWANQDSTAHTVTSDSDSPQKGLDSGTLNKGQSYSFTFDKAGTYHYLCKFHPNMQAEVEVVE